MKKRPQNLFVMALLLGLAYAVGYAAVTMLL